MLTYFRKFLISNSDDAEKQQPLTVAAGVPPDALCSQKRVRRAGGTPDRTGKIPKGGIIIERRNIFGDTISKR